MASITIRNLDGSIKEKLRLRAAAHGRSMEEEVRLILGELGNAIPMATPQRRRRYTPRARYPGAASC